MTTVSHAETHVADDSVALARRIAFHAFCQRHYVHLVGDVDNVMRDERAAAVVVEEVFGAILGGQIPVPATDTYRRLRELVLRVAARSVEPSRLEARP
jgi:hypothetical protein